MDTRQIKDWEIKQNGQRGWEGRKLVRIDGEEQKNGRGLQDLKKILLSQDHIALLELPLSLGVCHKLGLNLLLIGCGASAILTNLPSHRGKRETGTNGRN